MSRVVWLTATSVTSLAVGYFGRRFVDKRIGYWMVWLFNRGN